MVRDHLKIEYEMSRTSAVDLDGEVGATAQFSPVCISRSIGNTRANRDARLTPSGGWRTPSRSLAAWEI